MKAHLKAAIELQGMTVAKLAVAIGRQPWLISNLIQSKVDADPDLRQRIAEALNADERWLFRELTRIPPLVRQGGKGQEPKRELAGVTNVAR